MHSILPPSSAHIWGAPYGCLGWVNMMAQVPEKEPTESSLEGDVAHEVSAGLINARISYAPDFDSNEWLGRVHDNGVEITGETLDGAEVYAGDFLEVYRSAKKRLYGIEKQVTIGRIHAACFGTPDAWLYDKKNHTLYVWDFKFGYLLVEAARNLQQTCYAAGLFDELAAAGVDLIGLNVEFRIVQPRAPHRSGPVRHWRTSYEELTPTINELKQRAEQALNPIAKVRSGPHCRFCDARYCCEAAARAGLQLYEMSAAAVPLDPTPLQLGVYLSLVTRAEEQIKALRTGLEEQVKTLKTVPGWSLEPTVGRETWNRPDDEVKALGELMGVNVTKEALLTPKQTVKAGIPEEIVKAYSCRKSTGYKLTQDDPEKVKRIFE